MKKYYYVRMTSDKGGVGYEHWRVLGVWFFQNLTQIIINNVEDLESKGHEHIDVNNIVVI